MNFIATSSSVTLQFKNLVSAQSGGLDLGLDNVSVASTGQATGSSPITLFDANTTCASCQAVQPVGLVPGVGAETPAPPAFFSGLPVTLGGITYGATSKFGGGNGGFTGWIHVSYTVPAGTPTGNFILQFETSNAGDTSLPSALAIDNIVSPGLTESFENGIPATWTLSGGAAGFPGATGGTSPTITNLAPTNGSQFAWITNGCSDVCNTLGSVPTSYGSLYQGPGTNGLPVGQGLGSSVSGTTLQSPTFALAAGNTISFDVNFGTNDGTFNFPDWAAAQLIPTQTGVPISTAPTQTFTFNNAANNLDQYTADYSNAANTILANGDATPIISDIQITPTDWANVVAGTPFATTQCIAIAGANGNCTRKKQVCTTPTNSTPAGANCLQSSARNILLSSTFDPVALITDPANVFGDVEFNDSGACPLEGPGAVDSCPQNGLVSFTGAGQYTGTKGGKHTNSNNTLVNGVRPPSTTVTGFVNAAGWTNSPTPTGTLTGNPATLPVPNSNNMVVAAIANVTYGTNPASSGPPSTLLPIPTDTTLTNPHPLPTTTTCPNPIPAQPPLPPAFGPNSVTLGPFADGSSNLLHYFTTDCATTEDLKFTFALNPISNKMEWFTNFNSLTINVDLTKPAVNNLAFLPNPAKPGQSITASYSCSDPLTISAGTMRSGIASCGKGTQNFTKGTFDTGTQSDTFTVPTTANGPQPYSVTATDVAGNSFTLTANYSVVVPGDLNGDGTVGCDDLAIVKASFGKKVGQVGFNPIADVNHDGVVNILDLSFVASRMPAGTKCP
jgi:hypothetical protein